MKNRLYSFAGITVLSMALAMGFASYNRVQAVESNPAFPVSEWSTNTYTDSEDMFLSTVMDGYVLTFDGEMVSDDATIKLVISDKDVYFRLFDQSGEDCDLHSSQPSHFYYSLKAMGLDEITGTAVNEKDSNKWFVTGEPTSQESPALATVR